MERFTTTAVLMGYIKVRTPLNLVKTISPGINDLHTLLEKH